MNAECLNCHGALNGEDAACRECWTGNMKSYAKLYDEHHSSPCEQIRHEQEVSGLREALEAILGTINAAMKLSGGYNAPVSYKMQAIESIASKALAKVAA